MGNSIVLFTSLYLIKVCVYILAFYIPFVLFLKRTTFFDINRAYLILGLLLSFGLPVYTEYPAISSYTPTELPFVEPILTHTELIISQATESTGSINLNVILLILYMVGIGVRFVVLAFSVTEILKLKSQAEISTYQNIKVFRTNIPVPFSFFNCVFLPKALHEQGILEHEAAHARQYHWLDLLILELVSIILWFNPIIVAYKRSLKEQHEYLADRTAIKSGINVGEYLKSIRQQIELAIPSPLTSEFYFQSIKNRVNMLTKKRTSPHGLAAYTLVLPVIICVMMAFSPKKSFQITGKNGMDTIQEKISLYLPLDKKSISLLGEGYGDRLHPVLGEMRLHTGVDFFAEEGVPVVSTENGVVVKAQMAEAWGNLIVVQHDDTYSTSYSHLNSMSVKKGDKVQKGQQIGSVGHTGLSTKNHLHFELHKNGVAIDPITYLPAVK
jgi:hypothetical protein